MSLTSGHVPMSSSSEVMSHAAPEETVQAILSRVRKNVESRNINLKPTFLDFDRLRKGFIPKRFGELLPDLPLFPPPCFNLPTPPLRAYDHCSRWGQAQGILRLGLEGDEWVCVGGGHLSPPLVPFLTFPLSLILIFSWGNPPPLLP